LILLLAVALYYGWATWLNHELEQAKMKLDQQRWEDAKEHIQRLRMLQPSSETNEYLYAAALRHTDPQAALEALEDLIDDPNARYYEGSAITYLELCLELEHGERADKMIEQLAPSMSDHPKFMMLRARRLNQRGELDKAIEEINFLLDIEPNNPEAQWVRAQILLEQPLVTNWIEAKSALKVAATSSGYYGFQALMALGERPEIKLFPDEREWIIGLLERRHRGNVKARFMAATQQMILEPERKKEIAQATAAKESDQSPILVGHWLLAINENELAQGYIEKARQQSPKAKEVWKLEYQAAIQNQDLEALANLMQSKHSAATEVQRRTLQAMIDLNSEHGLAQQQWIEAFELARESENFGALSALARTAASQRWWPEAESAYSAAIDNAGDQIRTANVKREMLAVLLAQKKIREALQVSKDLKDIYPNNPVYQNNYYYFRALLGEGDADQVEQFQQLMQRLPIQALNATLAYLLYQDGEYQLALEKLNNLPPWMNNQADVLLLKGLLAHKMGNEQEAQAILSSINPENLLPPEVDLQSRAIDELSK